MNERVCPWYMGYVLANPLRRLMYNPEKLLRPYVRQGAMVLDIGCAMGFFTIPVARMVGDRGKVIAIDVQERMLGGLRKRAVKAGMAERIDMRLCRPETLGLGDINETADFALLFAVLHEMPDALRCLSEIYTALKVNGILLIAEPPGHTTAEKFTEEKWAAGKCGFRELAAPEIGNNYTILLQKPALRE